MAERIVAAVTLAAEGDRPSRNFESIETRAHRLLHIARPYCCKEPPVYTLRRNVRCMCSTGEEGTCLREDNCSRRSNEHNMRKRPLARLESIERRAQRIFI